MPAADFITSIQIIAILITLFGLAMYSDTVQKYPSWLLQCCDTSAQTNL